MDGRPIDLLKPQTWRAFRAFFQAVRSYHRGDYGKALAQLDKSMELDAFRTDVDMAFRTVLLVLNNRPDERLDLLRRIVAGQFRQSRSGSKYARAYADYWLGYATGRQDIVPLWSRAYALKPTNGIAGRYLSIPDSPILSDVLGR
jgi:hypothetical protein